MTSRVGEAIFDLDEIIETPITIKLHGTYRQILPIKLQQFFAMTRWMAAAKDLTSEADYVDSYFDVFKQMIEPFEKVDVQKMSAAQCASLMLLIQRRMHGERAQDLAEDDAGKLEAVGEAQKKKSRE